MKALLLCGLAALAAPAPAQDVVAVKAGRVITVSGPDLENATVLIRDGVIAEIGPDVEVPWDAEVVDASDGVVLPTWVIAHTSDGMRGSNENLANVPYLTVMDAVDPSSDYFRHALANGVGAVHVIPGNSTLIGGQGMVVRPFGRTVEDMAIRSRSGLKLSLFAGRGTSRMGQIRKMRRAFEDIEKYLADFERRKKEHEQAVEAGAADEEWDEEYDRTKKPVIDLLRGEIGAFLYVPSAAEVEEALRLADRFETTLVLGPRCYRAASAIARLEAPVVLHENLEIYEEEDDGEDERLVCPAKVLHDAGVPFALSTAGPGRGNTPADAHPWWQLATLVRHGIDQETALASLTVVPARILGIGDTLGSLEVGKAGSLQVLTGDPFAATTWVETVVLDGEVVYRRDEDPRLKHLFGAGDQR